MLRSRYLLHRVPDLKAKLCKGVRYSLRCVLMVKEGSANLGRNQLNWLLLTGNNLRYSFVFFMQMTFLDTTSFCLISQKLVLKKHLNKISHFDTSNKKILYQKINCQCLRFHTKLHSLLIDLLPTRTSVTKR